VSGGPHQSGQIVAVFGVDVHALVEKETRHRGEAASGGIDDRRFLRPVDRLRIGALLHQKFDDWRAAHIGGGRQWRHAGPARQIYVGPTRDQKTHDRQPPRLGRLVECGRSVEVPRVDGRAVVQERNAVTISARPAAAARAKGLAPSRSRASSEAPSLSRSLTRLTQPLSAALNNVELTSTVLAPRSIVLGTPSRYRGR
jgi:hypothetical protein